MNVYMINSGNPGCSYVRILLPAFANGFRTDKKSVASSSEQDPKKIDRDLQAADVVVMHRPENKQSINMIKLLKENGKTVIIDNDDTFKIEDKHPLAEWASNAVKLDIQTRDAYFDKAASMADFLTASTDFLAEEYKKRNPNVAVLPNCVDPSDWPTPRRTESKKVRIGMVGSVSYAYDYAHIKPVLKELSDRSDTELVMFGFGDSEHKKKNPQVTKFFKDEYNYWESLNIEHMPWVPIEDYHTLLNKAELDIILIPRRDNYFNRCKSNLKFLEAGMCEIPVIAQSFEDGPYEEIQYGKTGMLIHDNSDWMSVINMLVKDKDLRRTMGKNARKYVLKNYNIDNRAHEWEDVYKNIYENKNRE